MYGKILHLISYSLYGYKFSKTIDTFINELLERGTCYDADATNLYINYQNSRYKISVDLCYKEIPGSTCHVYTNFGTETELVYGYNYRRPSLITIIKLLKTHKLILNNIQQVYESRKIHDAMIDKIAVWSKELPISNLGSNSEELYLVKDKDEYCLIWLCKDISGVKIIHADDFAIYKPEEFCRDGLYYYGPIKLNTDYPNFNSTVNIESIIDKNLGVVKICQSLSKNYTIKTPSVL